MFERKDSIAVWFFPELTPEMKNSACPACRTLASVAYKDGCAEGTVPTETSHGWSLNAHSMNEFYQFSHGDYLLPQPDERLCTSLAGISAAHSQLEYDPL